MTGEDAWKLLAKAIKERDIDDVKEAIQIYVKAQDTVTYVHIEEALRNQSHGLYLIPKEKPNMAATLTNMDLQGNLNKKYTVNFRWSNKPMRPSEREGWPATQEEVVARLADAGETVPLGVPKCSNCDELGHTARACTEEKIEADRVVIKCFNCDQEGHRVRDCPTPRVDKWACKNCGKSGHKVAECPEPRSAEGVECRKCNEVGHFSKDCPKGGGGRGCRNCGQEGHMAKECTEPRNMAMVQCRNCDEHGHFSKECPKPRDMARVKCSNCQEMGHYKSRCKNAHVSEDGGVGGGDGGGFDNAGGFDDAGAAGRGDGVPAGGDW